MLPLKLDIVSSLTNSSLVSGSGWRTFKFVSLKIKYTNEDYKTKYKIQKKIANNKNRKILRKA